MSDMELTQLTSSHLAIVAPDLEQARPVLQEVFGDVAKAAGLERNLSKCVIGGGLTRLSHPCVAMTFSTP